MRSGTSASGFSDARRQLNERHDQRENETQQQRRADGLAKALVVLAAARPRHERLVRRKLADLALDDPFLLAPLLFFERFEEDVLHEGGMALLLLDAIDDRGATILDLAQALIELIDARTHAADVIRVRRLVDAVAPEQGGAADARPACRASRKPRASNRCCSRSVARLSSSPSIARRSPVNPSSA